ncbi:MAG TPA: hypothetical protein PLS49_01570, partial [Candidatus Woesebacteria bacterium]|nr:hypothetical protein [Candidatus Woesebacteria bacterium]
PMNRQPQQVRQPVQQPQVNQQSEHPQPINNTPMPQQQSFDRQARPADVVEQSPNDQEMDDAETWLKPKIFSESDGLV